MIPDSAGLLLSLYTFYTINCFINRFPDNITPSLFCLRFCHTYSATVEDVSAECCNLSDRRRRGLHQFALPLSYFRICDAGIQIHGSWAINYENSGRTREAFSSLLLLARQRLRTNGPLPKYPFGYMVKHNVVGMVCKLVGYAYR